MKKVCENDLTNKDKVINIKNISMILEINNKNWIEMNRKKKDY